MILTNTPECPYGYRPYPDSSTNALNPCFLSLVTLSEALFFVFIGSIQLFRLVRETKAPPNCRYFSFSSKYLQHLADITLQVILLICALAALFHEEKLSKITVYSYGVNLAFVLFISLPTQYLQYFKSPCSLGNQLFYYMLQIIILAFQLSQRYAHAPDQSFNLIKGQQGTFIEISLFVNSIIIFVDDLCLFKPSIELKRYYEEKGYYFHVNCLAYITFTWMNELLIQTNRDKKIKDPHNLPLPPVDLNIRKLSQRLQGAWEGEMWMERNSLLKALIRTFGKSIVVAILYETAKDLLSVIQPQLLRLFILCFNMDFSSQYPVLNGAFIALGLFLTSVFSTFLHNQFYITIFEVGLGMKGSLLSLVYQKALKLSLASREKKSTGDILNMTAVDIMKIQRFFEDCQVIVGAPIQIIVVLTSLYWLLGKATIGGLVTMAIMIPINSYLSKKVEKLFKTQMKYKDARIRTTTEIFNSIKSIKLYAWEKPMLAKLDHVRNDLEIENFKKIGIVSNMIYFAWNCVPLMVTCSTFAIFSVINDIPLSPQIVFPSLILFNILNDAIYSLPSSINEIIETRVSMNRVKDFLLSEELDDSFLEISKTPLDNSSPIVEIVNATFLWKSRQNLTGSDNYDEEATVESTKVALKNIEHFQADKGRMTCIVGRVGSGKSTMLRAILGQLPIASGSQQFVPPKVIIRASTVAYCPQEPWVMNATIKENILFGHRFDESYYHSTIKACQLLPDLDILPDADETLVGEKGISLSGGQKARLSLARAVYSRADLYLLDDILSAVDAEVGKNITEKVLDEKNGLLRNKTIILTTNAVSVLKKSQNIYVLQRGSIVEEGSYRDVISGGETSILKRMIEEFGTDDEAVKSCDSHSIKEEPPALEDSEATNLAESIISIDAENEMEILNINSRRASMATFAPHHLRDSRENNPSDRRNTQQKERTEEGRVKASVYVFYIKSCGITGVVLFFLFMILSRVFDLAETFWLKYWSESNEKNGKNDNLWMFVGVYALIGVGSAAFNNLRTIVMLLYCSIRGSKKLHDTMAKRVLRSPMNFFGSTPVGRLINRFSSDIQVVDSNLQSIFSFFFRSLLNYLVTVILISYNMPWFLVFNAVILIIYIYYQTFYVTLCRELKRLTSASLSPVMSLVSESLGGHEVINAFKHFERFNFINYENVQYSINCNFNLRSTNRWLSVRLLTIGAFVVLVTALLALSTINTDKRLSAGMVGLLMSYALQVTSSLMWIIRLSVQIETNIVSVERIYEYCNLPSEAPEIIESCRPEKLWPAHGSIIFKDYSTRYSDKQEFVLKNVNIEIKPREKIGVVGRTGAGKSTLSLALFRILEAVEGSIEVDNIDIAKIGLSDLRSHLAIIPQDAQALEGTIRSNLDPFNQYSTEELWRSVELSHLKPHIIQMFANSSEEGSQPQESVMLEAKVNENGSNLSVGQRQLLCLSRALLNKSKVLVLDEATAAVDMETDKIIQQTIRNEFEDRTIITIAHRIDTVLDCDRILVLDKGTVKEFDTPHNLLSDKQSMFFSLCEKGGYLGKYRSEASKI